MDTVILLLLLATGIIAGYILHYLLNKNKTVPRAHFEARLQELTKTNMGLQYTNEELSKLTRQYNDMQAELRDRETALVALRITASNDTIVIQNHQQKNNELNLLLTDTRNMANELENETVQQKQSLAALSMQLQHSLETLQQNKQLLAEKDSMIANLQSEAFKSSAELNKLHTYNNVLTEKLNTHKQEMLDLQESAHLQFEKIARLVFEEKAARFTETNKLNIENILAPLKTDISNFKIKVEETYDKESKQRFSLEEKVKDLIEQTNKVSSEANNLASALKGQSKTQGNWGEMILERILETSGLTKGREYFTQQSMKNEEGKNLRPDIFVHLPDNRVIIIDSKVSLLAYERYFNMEDGEDRKNQLQQHLKSVYNHIDELSRKKYDDLENALDFTMMFIPIEPAYMVSLQADTDLWNYAYTKRILLVSPTNLIACLKIISDVWKREKQSRNAREIVKRGELLYEKVVSFVTNMEELGRHLNKTQQVYQTTVDQLKNSKGNIVYQALQLQSLGLKSNKTIPDTMLPGELTAEDLPPDETITHLNP